MHADFGSIALNIMRILKIINSFVLILFMLLLSQCVIAVENKTETTFVTNKSTVNVKSPVNNNVKAEADSLFNSGLTSKDESTKEAYLSQALAKYMLLLSINPNDIYACTQIGVIHDNLNHSVLAKEYLYRAVNINPSDPYPNFYFGEYFLTKRDYHNALKYYKKAYELGYKEYFEVNFRLGTVYEKLGDIEKAKHYYRASKIRNPYLKGMYAKIKALDNVYYSKSDYKK